MEVAVYGKGAKRVRMDARAASSSKNQNSSAQNNSSASEAMSGEAGAVVVQEMKAADNEIGIEKRDN